MNLSRSARKRLPFLLDFFSLFYPSYEEREQKRADLELRLQNENDPDAEVAIGLSVGSRKRFRTSNSEAKSCWAICAHRQREMFKRCLNTSPRQRNLNTIQLELAGLFATEARTTTLIIYLN